MANPSDDLAALQEKLREVQAVCGQIGQPPQAPPTMRGSVGASLVSMVRRMLFWYTPPLRASLQGLTQVVGELIGRTEQMQHALEQHREPDTAQLEQRLLDQVLERERIRSEEWKEWLRQEGKQRENLNLLQELGTCLQTQEEMLQQEGRRSAGLEEMIGRERERGDRLESLLAQEQQRREEIENRLREHGETLLRECLRNDALESGLRQEHVYREGLEARINSRAESFEQERRHIAEVLQQERMCSIDLEGRLREQVDSVQQLQDEQRLEEYTGRLQKSEERLQILRRELIEHAQRVSRLLEEVRKRLPAPLDREQMESFGEEEQHDLDPLYIAFEDALRGPREEIQSRLRVYLPLLEKVRSERGALTVLDVGCGRGEWLDLLRKEGYSARGVDFNRSMTAECRERQLEVECADALEYLSRVADGSVGVVTVFHMVEHIPFRQLVRLLDEVTRVLQSGGMAIFETPNPNNFLVGSRNFYFDPTHRNPIPNETLRFLVEARGLCQVKVMPLNPCDPCNHVPEGREESAVTRRFNEYFYGPQDYAVIGRKI